MNTKLKSIIKSISYVFVVHCLSIVNMVLYTKGIIGKLFPWDEDITVFLIQGAIFIIFAPIYFGMKGDTETPWLYLLTTFISHLVFAVIVYYAFSFASYDVSFATIFWEYILMAFFGLVILLDMGIILWRTVVLKEK